MDFLWWFNEDAVFQHLKCLGPSLALSILVDKRVGLPEVIFMVFVAFLDFKELVFSL